MVHEGQEDEDLDRARGPVAFPRRRAQAARQADRVPDRSDAVIGGVTGKERSGEGNVLELGIEAARYE